MITCPWQYVPFTYLWPEDTRLMDLNFCSLSSGSSGNCYYIGNGFHGILIDAGISATSIRRYLRDKMIPMDTIMGVLITHNHVDHTRGLEVLLRKNKIPAYTTRAVWKSILNPKINISKDCIREIGLKMKFSLAGFDIEAFPVSHDSPETLGFHVSAGEKKITIATDLGYICETSAYYLKKANLLVIESNYDEMMLMDGSYPPFLKSRIKSGRGHLGNHQTAAFLAEMINDDVTHVCLAHLSKNNNTPEKVLEALHQAFAEKGIPLNGHPEILVLERDVPAKMISLTN